ncbi:hypothetical protein [Aquimarina latercula]|nr:hypothetical protein [Aquimarina latercula]
MKSSIALLSLMNNGFSVQTRKKTQIKDKNNKMKQKKPPSNSGK